MFFCTSMEILSGSFPAQGLINGFDKLFWLDGLLQYSLRWRYRATFEKALKSELFSFCSYACKNYYRNVLGDFELTQLTID